MIPLGKKKASKSSKQTTPINLIFRSCRINKNESNFDFSKMNIIFGTDAEPFIFIIDKNGVNSFLPVPLSLKLKNYQSVARLSKDEIIFTGGVNHTFNMISRSVYKLNLSTFKVSKLPKMNFRKYFSKLAVYNGRLISIGGRGYGNIDQAIISYCEEYNFLEKKWQHFPDLLVKRSNFDLMCVDDSMFVIGGIDDDSQLVSDIEKFNPIMNRWEVLGLRLTPGLTGHLSFIKGNNILVLGGNQSIPNGMILKADVSYGYDLAEFAVTNLKKKNVLAKAIVMGDYYYIFGGYHNHKFFVHRESLKVVQKSDLPENFLETISRFEKNGNKSVVWSKCSYLMADDV